MRQKAKLLVVDDEPFNLDIMTEYLSDDGYEVICAEDGVIALQKLDMHRDVDLIVLDRMMPNMDGMEVLKRVKADTNFHNIPIIMQTAAAQSKQIFEGIKAGVYYYLTKPYVDFMLLNIVNAALLDAKNKKEMIEEVREHKHVFGMMKQSCFGFRTLEDTKNLAYFIANCFPNPENVIYGLSELLINAVEHGNLGITYEEKTNLILASTWKEEVERRLMLPQNHKKLAYLSYELMDKSITVRVRDQGLGFDSQPFMSIDANRTTDLHGRGIAMSRMLSFDSMEYIGCGNEVICTVLLP